MKVLVVPCRQGSMLPGFPTRLLSALNAGGFHVSERHPGEYLAAATVIWGKRKKRLVVVAGDVSKSRREVVGSLEIEIRTSSGSDLYASFSQVAWLKWGVNNDAFQDYSFVVTDEIKRQLPEVVFEATEEFKEGLKGGKRKNREYMEGCRAKSDLRKVKRKAKEDELKVRAAEAAARAATKERRLHVQQTLDSSPAHRILRKIEGSIGRVERVFTGLRLTFEGWRSQDIKHAMEVSDGDDHDWG